MVAELTKYIDILKKCILFKDIDLDKDLSVFDCLTPKIKQYKAGNYIALEGSLCEGACIMLEGEAAIIRTSIQGESNIINLIGPSEIFGEIPAFSDRKHWPVSVLARKDSIIMLLPSSNFISRCAKQCGFHNKLTENMLLILADKIMILNNKINYLTLKDLRTKICVYLLEQRRINESNIFNLQYSRNELADFFGVTRPSLSRELSNLKKEGVIDIYRSSIKIIEPEVLIRYAKNI